MRIYEGIIKYRLIESGKSELLDSPERVFAYMSGAFDQYPVQESFWVIALNRKNRALGRFLITLGTVSGSLVHAREVFKPAILATASAVILCHNHPSGDPAPSSADVKVTRSLRSAAEILDIDLLDHVIIGAKEDDRNNQGYYSFADAGLI